VLHPTFYEEEFINKAKSGYRHGCIGIF